MKRPTPNALARSGRPYSVPRPAGEIDLHLDGNEGMTPPSELLESLAGFGPDLLRRYPDARPLEALLAERLGVDADRVLVTAGADDALDRVCRAMLGPGRGLVLPVPTFEMLHRYPALLGAPVEEVPWPEGPYPLDAVLQRVGPATAAVAVVSPNNPTGLVATEDDLCALARAAPHALLIVDHAYVEFCDEDLTAVALELPGAVVVRSFSKAFGLAGLRVGYAVGSPEVIGWLRAAGSPYPVSRPSLAVAAARLAAGDADVRAYVERVRLERERLADLLESLGVGALRSRANFVLARHERAGSLQAALAAAGIAVRAFPDRAGLEDALRITCPGEERAFARLCTALRRAVDDPSVRGERP